MTSGILAMTRLPMTLATLMVVAGCATLEPALPVADPAIPAGWQLAPATRDDAAPTDGVKGATASAQVTTPRATEAQAAQLVSVGSQPPVPPTELGWRNYFQDERLQHLIDQALHNNRNLRAAAFNVERARALYGIQRADRLPSVGATVAGNRSGGDTGLGVVEGYTAQIGVAAFELDLFGRVRNLSDAALQRFFAEEGGRQAAQIALVAQVADTWLQLAADQEARAVAEATLESQRRSFTLTEQRHRLGAVSGLDLAQARTTVQTALADSALYAGRVEQGRNALALLVGGPVEVSQLPGRLESGMATVQLPAELSSALLLRRPDVRQAEHALRAANADIGAARAAFFPAITLTGAIGTISPELSNLFGSGTGGWSFMPQLRLPIFQGGRLRANLQATEAVRNAAVAQYEGAIQAGFREVADALALSATLAAQREAQQALVDAASNAFELSQARYRAGRDSFLITLDAQRTLYGAQYALIATRRAEQANRVALYRSLGGGLVERTL